MLKFKTKNTHLKTISSNENSIILETDQFSDGLQFCKNPKNTLVLLDLDNTVLSYRHTLGTDQWVDFDYNEFIKSDASVSDAWAGVLKYYFEFVPNIHPDDVYAVELETPQHIRDLQGKGFKVLALTSRGDILQNETVTQLEQFDIDFNQGSFKDKQKKFSFGTESVLYNGMILAGGKDKGKCLLEVLDIKKLPQTIIMYDDKLSNLQKVRSAIETLNNQELEKNPDFKLIQFIGIRYSRLDHKIQNVDKNIVELQKSYYKRVLSDSDAVTLLKAQAKKNRVLTVALQYNEATGTLNLYSYKPQLTKLLNNIIPNLSEHQVLGKVINVHGKDKQSFAYEFSKKEAPGVFKALAQHGLIEHDEYQAISPFLLKAQPAITHGYNLRSKRVVEYNMKTGEAVTDSVKLSQSSRIF